MLSHSDSSSGGSSEATDYLVDAHAIFAFQAIRKVRAKLTQPPSYFREWTLYFVDNCAASHSRAVPP